MPLQFSFRDNRTYDDLVARYLLLGGPKKYLVFDRLVGILLRSKGIPTAEIAQVPKWYFDVMRLDGSTYTEIINALIPPTPSTMVTAGTPGVFNNSAPRTMAELNGLGLNPGPAWLPGQWVYLGGGGLVYWDGTAFRPGKAPNPSTMVTAGAPGSFDKDTPRDIATLNALGIGAGPSWRIGQFVVLGNFGYAYWNGSTFLPGKAPALDSTSVTAGMPGAFDHAVPLNLALLNSMGIGSGPAWATGQYVTLTDGSEAYWDGARFLAGRSPAPAIPSTSVTAGTPGAFNNTPPANLAALNLLGIGTGPAWLPGEYVLLLNGTEAYWGGASFLPGKAPSATVPSTSVTAGAPGAFNNAVPANLAALNLLGIGTGPAWTTGQYVILTDGSEAHWNGTTFLSGRASSVSTTVTAGAPGSFDKDIPANLASLNALTLTGDTGARWATGEYVVLRTARRRSGTVPPSRRVARPTRPPSSPPARRALRQGYPGEPRRLERLRNRHRSPLGDWRVRRPDRRFRSFLGWRGLPVGQGHLFGEPVDRRYARRARGVQQ